MKAWRVAACAAAIWMAGTAASVPVKATPAPERAASGREEVVSHNFDRTVPLPSGQSVRMEHKFGDITVRTHASRDVHIAATIRVSASSQQEA